MNADRRLFHCLVIALSALLLCVFLGCDRAGQGPAATKRPDEKNRNSTDKTSTASITPKFLDPVHAPRGEGWKPLFNGKDLSGWKARSTERPFSWKVDDGVMVNLYNQKERGVDIVTEERFDDFELYYEYNCPAVSNSGVYLRGRYEIQICDDAGHPKYKQVQRDGAIYNAFPAPEGVSRGANQWQSVYAKMVGNEITVVFNGKKTVDQFKITRCTGAELDCRIGTPGAVMIQGNHGPIKVRHIFIRPIR